MKWPWSSGAERSRLLGEGLWVAAGQALGLVGRVVGIRILTQLVSPEVYGHVALLAGAGALAAGVLVSPVVQAAVRFYPDAIRVGQLPALRAFSSRYLRISSGLSATVLLVGGIAWSAEWGGGPSAWAYLGLSLGFLAEASRSYETGLLNAARKQAEGSMWLAADAWLRPAVAAAFVLAAGPFAGAVLLGYALGSFAVNLLFGRTRVVPKDPVPAGRDAWQVRTAAAYRAYAAPLVPLALLAWAFNLGDRYVLASVAGADATGLYAAAYGLASLPFLALSGILVTTLRPVLFEAVSNSDRRKERRILGGWIALAILSGVVGVVLLAWLGPWVVALALGSEFRVVAPLLPWIGAAYAIQGLQNVFETLIYARRRTGAFLVLSTASAAVAVVLYLVLIPRWGAFGAAVGTIGGMMASCVASVFLSRVSKPPVQPTEFP